jgi:hypothetical protein
MTHTPFSPVSALGGSSSLGRFFRDLRKLVAVAHGRVVNGEEFGAMLGGEMQLEAFNADEVAAFDRGYLVTRDVLRAALQLAIRRMP